ncbi:alpha/beta fold hydrolase [Nocardioides sp. LHG3406-4]|uniref:alpha/beta fold hydrolase n=1 Tax=Nocardioides sp. LHG3406-4 TaxID=2804575 RepID=UPI003CF4AA90
MSTTSETRHSVSTDGTRIAYDVTGTGPALVIVDGALCQRSMGPARGLASALAGDFSVHTYDRRGRGESDPGATAYSPQREIEDLAAVIGAAGGSAHVFSASSGAALALAGAAAGLPIERLVAYEAPFIVDDTHVPHDPDLGERSRALVEGGRPGDAVRLFMRTVGVPGPMLALMRLLPVWKKLTGAAHTLPHDYAIVLEHQQGRPLPDGVYAGSTTPTLVIAGGKSPAYMRNSQAAIAAAVPDARLETLPGQTHMIKAKVVAPVVTRHLLG